jgi:hypothetical protein
MWERLGKTQGRNTRWDNEEGSRSWGGILQSDLILAFPVVLHDCRTKLCHLILPISWIPSFQTTLRGTGDSRDATSGVYVSDRRKSNKEGITLNHSVRQSS